MDHTTKLTPAMSIFFDGSVMVVAQRPQVMHRISTTSTAAAYVIDGVRRLPAYHAAMAIKA